MATRRIRKRAVPNESPAKQHQRLRDAVLDNRTKDYVQRAEEERAKVAAAQMASKYIRPNFPQVELPVELHCPEIVVAYKEHFEVICHCATYIDHVASDRLRDIAAYNRYLATFDEVIAQLFKGINATASLYEAKAKKQATTSPRPYRVKASIAGPRARQLLDTFLAADRMLRHLQYLVIFEEFDAEELQSTQASTVRKINKAAGKLKSIKRQCANHLHRSYFYDRAQEERREEEKRVQKKAAKAERRQKPKVEGVELRPVTLDDADQPADIPVVVDVDPTQTMPTQPTTEELLAMAAEDIEAEAAGNDRSEPDTQAADGQPVVDDAAATPSEVRADVAEPAAHAAE